MLVYIFIIQVNIFINFVVLQQYKAGAPNENIYSSKPLKHSIVKRISVFKRYKQAYFYPLKIFHLFGFPS